jgi:hypothetical protein
MVDTNENKRKPEKLEIIFIWIKVILKLRVNIYAV